MRVLYIVDALPPDKGGRVNKVLRRIKYLVRQGWQVTVLAPGRADEPISPATVLADPSVTVYRTPYLRMKQWPSLRHNANRTIDVTQNGTGSWLDMAFVPKGFVRWFPDAVRYGLPLARQCDVILTMNNPIMLHLIGLALKRMTGKPWVAEFRDPIVDYSYSRRGPEQLNQRLESAIVHTADRIIQLQDFVPTPISERYLDLPQEKFITIPYTGYDPDDFRGVAEPLDDESKRFCTLIYTGSFYGDTITPLPLLRALAHFFAATPAAREHLRLRFAGDWSPAYADSVLTLGLTDTVTYLGYLSQAECVKEWRAGSFLLLILGAEAENDRRIPSKFWDYVGVNKPQLALVAPGSAVAELVHAEQLGIVANVEDEASIERALAQMWERWQSEQLSVSPSAQLLRDASCETSERIISQVLTDASSASAISI